MNSYNFLDFIEIGTSDFETEIQNATNITKGMSIELYNLIVEKGLIVKDIIMSYNISKKTLYDTINTYNINGVFYLKIDTEGHDCTILTKFLKDITDNEMLPHKILFESNSLTDRIDFINIIKFIIFML